MPWFPCGKPSRSGWFFFPVVTTTAGSRQPCPADIYAADMAGGRLSLYLSDELLLVKNRAPLFLEQSDREQTVSCKNLDIGFFIKILWRCAAIGDDKSFFVFSWKNWTITWLWSHLPIGPISCLHRAHGISHNLYTRLSPHPKFEINLARFCRFFGQIGNLNDVHLMLNQVLLLIHFLNKGFTNLFEDFFDSLHSLVTTSGSFHLEWSRLPTNFGAFSLLLSASEKLVASVSRKFWKSKEGPALWHFATAQNATLKKKFIDENLQNRAPCGSLTIWGLPARKLSHSGRRLCGEVNSDGFLQIFHLLFGLISNACKKSLLRHPLPLWLIQLR